MNLSTINPKVRNRLRVLLAEIERHNRLYYQQNTPEISDFEYDCLQAELQAIYKNFPELAQSTGPGSDLTNGPFAKVAHLSPMLSLANTYSLEELQAFDKNLTAKIGPSHTFILEPKVDGMAINLWYESGVLVRALTRGDGKKGEDVTANIKTIGSIPQQLPGDVPERLEVRGEVYITLEDFTAINKEQEQLGQEPFANARNLASGSVKLLDVDEVRRRRLSFVAHGIGYFKGSLDTQEQCRLWLKDKGFPVFPSIDKANSIQEAWAFIQNFLGKAKSLPYGTDGVVLKLNDRTFQQELGATAKFPRWAIAYKFEPEAAETRLRTVTFQLGRTGIVTPVAELEPVLLAGSRVSRATLHNFDEIKRKDIRIGDWVVLQKAGEVIPIITAVNKAKRPVDAQPIVPPTCCPSCKGPLSHVEDQVALRCTSLDCPEQIRLKLVHFASKEAMDIRGMGPKVMNVLFQKGWLRHMDDLFKLREHRAAWIQLEGFGPVIVDQLLAAIERAKHRPLWRFINALGIPEIGVESAKNLAQHFKSCAAIFEASLEELQAVPLVGLCASQSIQLFYANTANRAILQALMDQGLDLTIDAAAGPWLGKIFVLTGTLAQYSRDQAKQKIEALGGKVSSTVSAKTFAVIVGKNPGDKLTQSQKLNIPIWDENMFLEQLNAYAEN